MRNGEVLETFSQYVLVESGEPPQVVVIPAQTTNEVLRSIIQTIFQDRAKIMPQLKNKELSSHLQTLLDEINIIEPMNIGANPLSPRSTLDTPEISKEAFLILWETLRQCEDELRETRVRLAEERGLRASMQAVISNIADDMHSAITEQVAQNIQKITYAATVAGFDQKFCNELLGDRPVVENKVKNELTNSGGMLADGINIPTSFSELKDEITLRGTLGNH
jgi:hypothetical protein